MRRGVTSHVAHRIPEREPVRLAVGDTVTVGERDTDWPAFVFVTAPHGSGWVPARYLTTPTTGTRRSRVHTAYDTTELPTHAGEALEVLEEDLPSGWFWCRSANGREGWVPRSTLADGE